MQAMQVIQMIQVKQGMQVVQVIKVIQASSVKGNACNVSKSKVMIANTHTLCHIFPFYLNGTFSTAFNWYECTGWFF